MTRPRSVLAAALLLLAAAGCGPAEGASRPQVGAQFHGVWNYADEAEQRRALTLLRESGATWVRIDLGWVSVEQAPDAYDAWELGRYDQAVAVAHELGFRVLLTITGTPTWAAAASDEEAVLPDDPADYAQFAGDMARRYRGQVAAVELWNEPNNPDFLRAADPGTAARDYAALVRAAYASVKAAAPELTVLAGGTSYVDDAWWARLYARGIREWTDVVAVNPYMDGRPPTLPEDGSGRQVHHVAALLEVMAAHGDAGKPVWFTEFGWSTHPGPGGVSAVAQGRYLTQTLELVTEHYPQVTTVFWYNLRDRADSSVQNNNYGLLTRDLEPKAAYHRLSAYLHRRGRARVPGRGLAPPGP